MKTDIVLGTSWGDEGKGVVVDNLCNGPSTLVVRFSGGPQCGHCVMRDGKKHVFSNFGSGTIQGSKTFFIEHTTVFPRTFLKEYEILQEKGINPPRVYIHPMARITTIYDVAFNRASENRFRRHGSCGLGVGATMKRNDETCYNLYAIDLKHLEIHKRKLQAIGAYYENLVESKSEDFAEEYWDQLRSLGLTEKLIDEEVKSFLDKVYIVDIQHPKYDLGIDNVVFEGSQGIQLDMHHGVFPNVTYANTTSKNAVEYLKKWESRFTSIYYTTRCYGTRHGEGWIPNNNPVKLINNEEEINFFNEYQRNFKVFEFDQSIVEQSVAIDSIYHRDLFVSKHLVITCVDQRPEWTVPKFDTNFFKIHLNNSPKCGNMSIYGK
jgi:adenylosuccinate synthase